MYRFILEDTYESFIMNLETLIKWEGVHKAHTIRFNKNDQVNYQRLMSVTKLFKQISESRPNRYFESHYIFLEKTIEDLKKVSLINNLDGESSLKRKLVDTVMSSRLHNMYLEAKPITEANYTRFTSSHRLLTRTDFLFDNNTVVQTKVISNYSVQLAEKNINNDLSVKEGSDDSLRKEFMKLANEYKEEYLMSKIEFSDLIITDSLDLKSKILSEQEEFIINLIHPPTFNIKYIHKQKFDVEAKIAIMDKLESLNNI